MGGDGMGAMAALIFGAMALILLGGFGILFLVGWLIGRRTRMTSGKRWLTACAFGAVGLGIGALGVTATFYENSWAPPPAIRFTVPPGFAHAWVILLEDPDAPRAIAWTGTEMPFRGKSTTIAVPPSGVVRLRSLTEIAGRGDLAITWSDGAHNIGQSMGFVPAGLGAGSQMAFLREGADGERMDDLPLYDDALAAYIRQREGAR